MAFKFNRGGLRPSTHWNNVNAPLSRTLSPIHKHEFGEGYDIQYKDSLGNVQARMDGLTPSEAQYLKNIKGF